MHTRWVAATQRHAGDNKKKFITREEEPEEAWVSKGEKDGENPMKVSGGGVRRVAS